MWGHAEFVQAQAEQDGHPRRVAGQFPAHADPFSEGVRGQGHIPNLAEHSRMAGVAKVRHVKVERQVGEESVISEGLKAGETVVTDGQLRLTPGAAVSVQPAGARKDG